MQRPTRHRASGWRLQRELRAWCCAFFIVGTAACAQQRPVLYPNAHFEQVGRQVADAGVDECLRLADAYVGNTSPAGRAAKSTGVGAATGSAIGAAVGAIRGNPGSGAAAGAAGGGAGGLVRGILRGRSRDPIFQRYVERCLRDRGFETIGWR